MILLTSTAEKLQLVTNAAISTDWSVAYADHSATAFAPGSGQGNVATATSTDMAAAPASSVQRQVKLVTVRNRGASAQVVSVVKDVSGTDYYLSPDVTLNAGEALQYVEGAGWSVLDANGAVKVDGYRMANTVLMAPHFATANLTGVKTITSGSSFAVYVGKAPRAIAAGATIGTVRSRVTTAMATITWGEVAIAKGAISVGTNPSLTVVGYADVSATFNGTGQKSTSVNVSTGQQIAEGDDLWVLIGNAATTAAVMRAAGIADDIQVGLQASAAQRPSLIVGTPTAFTIEGATTLAAWVALVM